MKFYKLNSEQRKLWTDKLMDLANFAVVGLIFSQVVSDTGPNTEAMGFGVVIYVVLAVAATYLGGGLK